MRRLPLAAVALMAALLAAAAPSAQQPSLLLSQLTWFDRAGRQLSTVGPLADHGNLELSPDGRRVAVAVTDRSRTNRDIWIYEPDGTRTQLTNAAADENWLIWSPDGERVIYNSFDGPRLSLLQRGARGSGTATTVVEDGRGKWPVSWSPDGQRILVVTNSQATGNDIWLLPLAGQPRMTSFIDTTASENWAAFSPDGRYVAYSSTDPTGSAEVYVAPVPGDGRMWRISAEGGTQARWRKPDEIIYLSPNRELIAAGLRFNGNALEVTDLDPLFRLDFPYGAYHAFDVTPDGTRILVNQVVVSPATPSLTASLHP